MFCEQILKTLGGLKITESAIDYANIRAEALHNARMEEIENQIKPIEGPIDYKMQIVLDIPKFKIKQTGPTTAVCFLLIGYSLHIDTSDSAVLWETEYHNGLTYTKVNHKDPVLKQVARDAASDFVKLYQSALVDRVMAIEDKHLEEPLVYRRTHPGYEGQKDTGKFSGQAQEKTEEGSQAEQPEDSSQGEQPEETATDTEEIEEINNESEDSDNKKEDSDNKKEDSDNIPKEKPAGALTNPQTHTLRILMLKVKFDPQDLDNSLERLTGILQDKGYNTEGLQEKLIKKKLLRNVIGSTTKEYIQNTENRRKELLAEKLALEKEEKEPEDIPKNGEYKDSEILAFVTGITSEETGYQGLTGPEEVNPEEGKQEEVNPEPKIEEIEIKPASKLFIDPAYFQIYTEGALRADPQEPEEVSSQEPNFEKYNFEQLTAGIKEALAALTVNRKFQQAEREKELLHLAAEAERAEMGISQKPLFFIEQRAFYRIAKNNDLSEQEIQDRLALYTPASLRAIIKTELGPDLFLQLQNTCNNSNSFRGDSRAPKTDQDVKNGPAYYGVKAAMESILNSKENESLENGDTIIKNIAQASVTITKNSKGYQWEIVSRDMNIDTAAEKALKVEYRLRDELLDNGSGKFA